VAKSSRSRGRAGRTPSRTKKSKAKQSARPARKAKKTARARAPKAPKAMTGAYGLATQTYEKVIELRPIRLQLQSNVSRLGAAIGERQEAQPELEEALKRMSRWLDDIQEICGPDMAIPL
jgi:hypothetical protein